MSVHAYARRITDAIAVLRAAAMTVFDAHPTAGAGRWALRPIPVRVRR